MLNLKIKIPSGVKPKEIRGQLLSLFTAIEEIGIRKRKGSYLHHFFQERLDRKERRNLLSILNQFQNQLQERKEGISENQTETPKGINLPNRAQEILRKIAELGR